MTTISRRTAIAAPVVVIAANAIGSKADSNAVGDTGGDLQARKSAAIELRAATTARAMARELPHHPTNGDEENLRLNGEQSYIANYTKGLPHNNFGEVDSAAYRILLQALESGNPQLFERIPLSGVAPAELVGGHLRFAAAYRPGGRDSTALMRSARC